VAVKSGEREAFQSHVGNLEFHVPKDMKRGVANKNNANNFRGEMKPGGARAAPY